MATESIQPSTWPERPVGAHLFHLSASRHGLINSRRRGRRLCAPQLSVWAGVLEHICKSVRRSCMSQKLVLREVCALHIAHVLGTTITEDNTDSNRGSFLPSRTRKVGHADGPKPPTLLLRSLQSDSPRNPICSICREALIVVRESSRTHNE